MSPTNQNPARRLSNVRERIQSACQAAGCDPSGVRLLAVSKTQAVEKIRALVHLGQKSFGENYVDEALVKIRALNDQGLEWHFIGPLQSNKTRAVAEHFDWVQSLDRPKLIRRLAEQRPPDRPPLNVLIQVNLDGEAQKSGCDPGQIQDLASMIMERPSLKLRGLMAIPAVREQYSDQVAVFASLRELFDTLASDHDGIDTLSAGMSADLEAAIAAGSTMVRVGTDLFGARQYQAGSGESQAPTIPS
jgi:PLP dependent protein